MTISAAASSTVAAMGRRLPDWDHLAKAAGVVRCRGIRSDGSYCHGPHDVGWWEPGIVHWTDRTARWSSVARFIKLAARATDISLTDDPPWLRLYRTHLAMRDISRRAGIQLPARVLADDRLQVRMWLVPVPTDTPHRKEAMEWARRGVPALTESDKRAMWGDR